MTEPPDPFAAQPYGAPAATPHGQPLPYGTPIAAQRRNGYGITGFVAGLVSICLFWTVVAPAAALGFGIAGHRRVARGEATNGGLAVAGVVLGALGLLIGIAVDAYAFAHRDALRNYVTCVDDAAGNKAAIEVCRTKLDDDLRS